MRIVSVFLTLVLAASIALAQQSMPPQPPADKPAANGPSLEATLKFIQDKVNQQGKIVYVEHEIESSDGHQNLYDNTAESQVVSVDPAGGLSLQEQAFTSVRHFGSVRQQINMTSRRTYTWQVYFKDVEKLEVLNSSDYRQDRYWTFQYDPPFFEILVHLAAGKTVPQHFSRTVTHGDHSVTDEAGDNIGEFVLHFRDKEMANRVAKAMLHAVELCGGGPKPEPF
jgi:hypothetical protein